MARRPEDRYQTALELKDALETYLLNSSRPNEAEVGRFVSDTFAQDRVDVRLQIDEQLRKRRASGALNSIPPHASESSTSATVMDASVTSSGLRAAETARPSRAKGTLALSGLLVLVTAGLGISLSLGRGRGTSAALSPPVPAALAPASTAHVAPSSGAEPARVRIVVSAKPRTSELVIDGNKVEGGVYEAEVAPTLEPHQVRVSAPGFVPSERSVVFDRNVSFEVALVPAVARGGAPASTARPKSAASAPATTQPGVGARQIDDKDPYERKVVP